MKRVLMPLALMIAVLLLGFVLVFALGGLRAYAIPSSAMEPTLRCARPAAGCEGGYEDRIVMLSWGASYRRADIVAFDAPPGAKTTCGVGGTFVKRIIGLPGETVEIRLEQGASFVYVDRQRLEEPYIEHDRRDLGPHRSFRVPDDHYFVLGDNRAQSCDSRVFGPVHESNLIAEYVLRYWPLERISLG